MLCASSAAPAKNLMPAKSLVFLTLIALLVFAQ
jgi:hypothetical protein